MSNQLDVLKAMFPYSALFPKSCDLSTKPPASCVPASILHCVSMLTLNRQTVTKGSDDGTTQPASTSAATTTSPTSGGISPAAIAGIVIGSFAFVILVTFVAYVFWRRRRIAQAKLQAVDSHPKREEGAFVGGMNYPTPWTQHGGEGAVVVNPLPRRQKDGQYSSPPTRYDDSSDAHHSIRSTSIERTTYASRSPPSYLMATTSNEGSR
jgi:hypothetical protein